MITETTNDRYDIKEVFNYQLPRPRSNSSAHSMYFYSLQSNRNTSKIKDANEKSSNIGQQRAATYEELPSFSSTANSSNKRKIVRRRSISVCTSRLSVSSSSIDIKHQQNTSAVQEEEEEEEPTIANPAKDNNIFIMISENSSHNSSFSTAVTWNNSTCNSNAKYAANMFVFLFFLYIHSIESYVYAELFVVKVKMKE